MVPVDALTQASERRSAAPIRSVRRATARRASNRRAYARSRQSDSDASIIRFLAYHPRSTIGDLAKGLNLDPEHVASCLTHLASAGEIRRASHGYSAQHPDRESTGTPAPDSSASTAKAALSAGLLLYARSGSDRVRLGGGAGKGAEPGPRNPAITRYFPEPAFGLEPKTSSLQVKCSTN